MNCRLISLVRASDNKNVYWMPIKIGDSKFFFLLEQLESSSSRVRDDEKLAGSWLARGEGISAAWNVIFQFPIRTLESWLRSRDSTKVQESSFSKKESSSFMEKNSLLTAQYFWRYKLLLFCFFCLLIPEIDCVMFYFSISSSLALQWVSGINKSPKTKSQAESKKHEENTQRFMTWKSKSCNRKHLWHLES